ncbi:hypothetical protein NEPAR06_0408 [Nematocida parisii]|uniref:Uncharacterized protein n=1 Tax=Nematocida parisii (strain ERTm3) TaxID=935791 RepID=I3EIG1_NEMP3|nr:uncharacterized protein NEPG_01780 [Nematocida parisii ERTm1]EIJ89008.1 hypothetical protein NEQG_00827 [Nematocida parisii ERTm3]KAI5126516.1 hypothetical protein NEPAR03_0514 [Nematocida parisii]EIJ93438.1 hypothetical protein NEPG_01780 [Nematocida parisii ERTm1]KAI5128266.1 hypothetical protein NEPAR08_1130 [Nematocida parisii]KAI5140045.1 hypothetical protein NEPAR04_0019 [Nematocida parisii]|eukprot:XP_013059608.1 hypothetical protein NEPG_01780 [Nematocida parisii ERTm1]
MDKTKQEGILMLEDILSTVEEILLLSKITMTNKEKDIHREIKEGFQLKMKTEQLIVTVSSLYKIILQLETHQECSKLWKESEDISPLVAQKRKNLEYLIEYLDKMKDSS